MSSSSSPSPSFLLWILLTGDILIRSFGLQLGINYGQIADNLPSPSHVSALLQSMPITRVKLYDADPTVLSAFSGTDIEFTISVGNEQLTTISDPSAAQSWINQNVRPFLPDTKITCINVGNEVLAGTGDPSLASSLLPAMQSIHQSLVSLGLDQQVTVSTAHSLAILASSYPPSSSTFREDIAQYIQPILAFHSQTNSPFLINAYPFFAYKGSPSSVSLPYALFQPNPGFTDPNTNLKYDNMLYAQIDSVYAAMKAMGHTDITVRVSETGWPSKGDADEAGATPENAASYNGNLMQRVAMNQGTPLSPSVPIDVYVFALFNENMKPGPASERNYGLLYPDGTPVYNIRMQGINSNYVTPSSIVEAYSSSSSKLWDTNQFGSELSGAQACCVGARAPCRRESERGAGTRTREDSGCPGGAGAL